MKAKEKCRIVSQECIASDIYSMWLQTDTIAGNAVPGQFVSLYTRDAVSYTHLTLPTKLEV